MHRLPVIGNGIIVITVVVYVEINFPIGINVFVGDGKGKIVPNVFRAGGKFALFNHSASLFVSVCHCGCINGLFAHRHVAPGASVYACKDLSATAIFAQMHQSVFLKAVAIFQILCITRSERFVPHDFFTLGCVRIFVHLHHACRHGFAFGSNRVQSPDHAVDLLSRYRFERRHVNIQPARHLHGYAYVIEKLERKFVVYRRRVYFCPRAQCGVHPRQRIVIEHQHIP